MQDCLSRLPSEVEWEELFDMAVKQSLIGVCFVGLHSLGADSDDGYARIGMSENLYFKWMGMAAQINMKNEQVNRQCVDVQQTMEKAGFRSFIMKGQGNAVLYKPSGDLPLFRQSGDIDIYLDGGFHEVNNFVQSTYPSKEINELEIHYHCFEDTEVEIHFKPFVMDGPKDRLLQRFFDSQKDACFANKVSLPNGAGEICTPNLEFNLVHQLVHIHHHLFYEGVGLRQLMDYYFVIKNEMEVENGSSAQEVKEVVSELGLNRFASALMWVLRYVFGLTRTSMLWEPNEKDGKFLLEEIMLSGNFGKQDERQKRMHTSKWNSFWMVHMKTFRMWRFDKWAWLWNPIWRIKGFLWRKLNGYK